MKNKKLFRSESDKKIFGVCGGIAKYFDIDSTVIRLAWIILSLFTAGILAYILAAIIIPSESNLLK